VLRFHDPRTGGTSQLRPARPGALTTYTMAAPGGTQADNLRALLVTDLAGRVAAERGNRVSGWHAMADSVLWDACRELNIYPCEYAADPPGPVDLTVVAHGDATAGTPPGQADARHRQWIAAGALIVPGPGLLADGEDPLALRLALLTASYHADVRVRACDIAAAATRLRSWRALVARWASDPSRPMSRRYLTEVSAAIDDDLDFPTALRHLDALAADDLVPAGAKFETFAHLDQILGLDLAREVGRAG
jgi:hypothetical protein